MDNLSADGKSVTLGDHIRKSQYKLLKTISKQLFLTFLAPDT